MQCWERCKGEGDVQGRGGGRVRKGGEVVGEG